MGCFTSNKCIRICNTPGKMLCVCVMYNMHCDTGKVNHVSIISWEMYHSTHEVYNERCIMIHVKYMYDVSCPNKSITPVFISHYISFFYITLTTSEFLN